MNESFKFLPNQVLDTSGLKCPLPVLKAKKALKSMAKGSCLKVIATDLGAMDDFDHFCEATGDVLLLVEEIDGVLTFIIQKSDAS